MQISKKWLQTVGDVSNCVRQEDKNPL